MKLIIALFLASLCLANAFDDDSKICTEDQFECGTYSYYPLHHTMALSDMSYDFSNKRLYMDVYAWDYKNEKVEQSNTKYIAQFAQQKLYVIDEKDKCTCHSLPVDMRRFCVASDFEECYSFTFGRDLECEGFNWMEEYNGKTNISINVILTKEDRIPIQFSHYSDVTEGQVEFFNVTSGIRDPTIFNAPQDCDCSDSDTPRPSLHKFLPHIFGLHNFKLFA
eukprot:TRINITY_DN264_c0_g1_i1.p1 TRINITY_DN264_c0_g1~~TRINITY_DN264_c0_g1_i1.p1  ORF type:complete len:222 (-),score=35.39 TRINITY_DN264_c0_g1_i1:208-873(-)